MGWFTQDRGRLIWDVHLGLDAGYHVAVHPGPVLDWTESWLRAVEAALDRLPRALVLKAVPSYLFPARALDCPTALGTFTCHGISSEVHPLANRHHVPKMKPPVQDLERNCTLYWIGILEELLNDPTRPEKHLDVPELVAVVLEELCHVWDYRLEAQKSEYSSSPGVGERWFSWALQPKTGLRRRINVPNGKPDTGVAEIDSAEDWASAVVWYVLRPEILRDHDPAHYEFARDLFKHYGM
jgi:hypothetical protein